jgi:hypothetical protein
MIQKYLSDNSNLVFQLISIHILDVKHFFFHFLTKPNNAPSQQHKHTHTYLLFARLFFELQEIDSNVFSRQK